MHEVQEADQSLRQVSTIKRMNDFETDFENLHTSFVTSLAIYKNSCEKLLSPLMLPDNKLYELLENGSATSWEDAELGKSLHERLGQSYKPYKDSVKQLNKRITLFGTKLKLGDEMRVSMYSNSSSFDTLTVNLHYKPCWVMKDNTVDVKLRHKFFNSPWKRIKGGFESAKYDKLLDDIKSDISQIATLTTGAIALKPLRLERKRRANTTHYWIGIRDHARRLFETFDSHWSCNNCSCQHPHRASLRLDMRKDGNMITRFGFKLSFDLDPAGTAALPWYWRDVEIEPLSTPGST